MFMRQRNPFTETEEQYKQNLIKERISTNNQILHNFGIVDDEETVAKNEAAKAFCKLLVENNVSHLSELPLPESLSTHDNVRYYFGDQELPRPKQGW